MSTVVVCPKCGSYEVITVFDHENNGDFLGFQCEECRLNFNKINAKFYEVLKKEV